MKTTNHKVQRLLLAVVLLGLGACTGDFEDYNRNPNQVTEDQMEALNYKTGTKVKTLQSLVIPVQEHMYQFNESLDLQSLGRLAQVALCQRHHRDLHSL